MCTISADYGSFDQREDSALQQQVLDCARSLRDAERGGALPPVLRGRRLAVLCDDSTHPGAAGFMLAMEALAADVSRVRPNLNGDSAEELVRGTAALFGRLYDAIDCESMAPHIIDRLRLHAGVPVFTGLGLGLGEAAQGPAARADADAQEAYAWRRAVVQATVIEELKAMARL